MNRKALFFTVLICHLSMLPFSLIESQEILNSLSTERYFLYQDIIVNNQVLSRGVGPDCPSRYEAIKQVLRLYQRPIKVLDLGASNGYFSLRIAHDFDALCVMIDLSNRLCDICHHNDQIDGIIYLKQTLSLESLRWLNSQEHFDVVLALNIIHHLNPCEEILNVIFELGDTVIIETPPANDSRVNRKPTIPFIERYLERKPNGQCIALTARAESNKFEHIQVIDVTQDLLSTKEFSIDAYAKMFYFSKCSDDTVSLPNFKLTTFQALNGAYFKSKYLSPNFYITK